MSKKISVGKRMLAFVLTFVMAFTAISWGDVGEVKAEETNLLTNGDFETGDFSGWTVVTGAGVNVSVASDEWSTNTTNTLTIKNGTVADSFSLTQTIKGVESGTYQVELEQQGAEGQSGLSIKVGDLTEKELPATTGWNVWATVQTDMFVIDNSTDITVELSGTIPSTYWGTIDNIKLIKVEQAQSTLTNGDFETGDFSGWTVATGAGVNVSIAFDEWSTNNTSKTLTIKNGTEDDSFSLTQTIKGVENGTYQVALEQQGAEGQSGLSIKVGDLTEKELPATTGWDVWETVQTDMFEIDNPTDITVELSGTIPSTYWGTIDNIKLIKIEKVVEPVDSTLYVPYVKGITDEDGFIRGADVSSYYSVVQSGGKYYDANGQELNDQQFFDLLHESGVNTIRLRVWVDPYDAQGQGYGGGNNDLDAAVKMGQWASNAGMGVLIDFHYSDFWADPGKQAAPKVWEGVWEGLSVADKADKISEYTARSLKTLLDANVNVTMVQVGNETNGSMCGVKGEGDWTSDLDVLFDAGCDAVHRVAKEYNRTIKAVLHFTNPETAGRQAGYAKNLSEYDGDKDGVAEGVSYDVFATSYYPYWHGTISNLTSVLSGVADTYDKEVMVAETSWATTLEDGDGHANTVRVGNNDEGNEDEGFTYSFSEQGQANEMTAVVKAVKKVGEKGLGVFFWEPTWIPVQYAYNEDGTLNQTTLASNKEKWEQFGSGWASSYGGTYDPADAGKWFGGCAVDNENWFDFNGKAMEGIKIFKLLQTGTTASASAVESIDVVRLETTEQQEIKEWPTEVDAITNDGKIVKKNVTWSDEEKSKVDYNTKGIYTVNGTIQGESTPVIAKVTVLDYNYLLNGSFDKCTEQDSDGWNLVSGSAFNFKDMSTNSKNGNGCLHFYSGNDADLVLATTAAIVDKGTYQLNAFVQGGGGAETNEFGIYAVVQGKEYKADAGTFTGMLTGWKDWKSLTVSNISVPKDGTEVVVALYMKNYTSDLWGSFDEVTLIKTGDYSAPDNGNSGSSSNPPSYSSSDSSSTPSASTDNKNDTTTTKNPDGTTTETKTETATNESGKEVETTVTTNKDADGKVTGSTEVSTIAGAAKDTTVTVTVEKDAKGNVAEAVAEVTKKGTETKTGTKGTISSAVVAQIKEAAGSKDVAITTSVTGADGKEKYSVTVDANDLVAGAKLTVVVKDAKTGKAVLVDAKQVKVTAKGGVNVVLPEGNDYTLIDAKEAAKVTKEILKTVEPAKTSATLKAGKSNTAKLSTKLDMDNVKKITYTTSKKSVVTVNKNGKVVAKKAGTATITIKVTLNNGKTKTVKMKYNVK